MQKLKDNFLNLGIVIDNEYLDKYCSLVKDNLGLPKQVHKNTGKKRSIETRQKMQDLIIKQHKETNNTIIMVTHSKEEAQKMCDVIIAF